MNRYFVYNEKACCVVVTEDCKAEVAELVKNFKPKDNDHLALFFRQEVGYEVEENVFQGDDTIYIGTEYPQPTCLYCGCEITYEQYATGGMCSMCMDDKIQEYEREKNY